MRFIYLFIFIFLLNGCSNIRDSAGVSRKSIDEFQVFKNPALVIHPDFNLLPPEQLKEKNIDTVDQDLAKEILFGSDINSEQVNANLSVMSEILLEADVTSASSTIREEIDEEFAREINSKGILNNKWNNKNEVLNAIQESERLRDMNFDDIENEVKNIEEIKINKKEKVKVKKKKKFFFF